MSVDQLRLPKTTCPLPFAEGAATCTTWISRAMATASSSVSVYWVPWPRRAPLEVTLPDVAMMRLVPRLSIRSVTLACAPVPTPTMAITAPTPMMMPSILNALRSLFTRSARRALRALSQPFTPPPPPRDAPAPARAPRSGGQPRVDQRELDVFEGARPGQEIVCLEDEPDLAVADPCELRPREAGDILAVQDVPAGRGRVETAEKVHEGGLPRAGGAHHRHELAALDLDRQATECMNRVWAEWIVLREPLGDDQRHGSAPDAGRAPALARFLPATATTMADDDFLPHVEVASEDLGRAAVGEAEPERHGLGLAVRAPNPHPPANATPPVVARGALRLGLAFPGLVVLGLAFLGPGLSSGRPEPQGCVRDLEHARLLGDDQLHIRGHPRQEMPVGIVDSDDHGVGDDALHDLSGLADLHDPAVEGLARKGVHRELRGPVDPDTPDVSLVDAHLDLHFRQVSSDGEEGRRRQTRRDRSPDIHRPRHHHAVDRRVDRGVLEIEARLVQRRFLLLHLRAGGLQHRFCHAELCLGGPDGGGERLLLGARSVEHSDGGVIGGLGRVVFALGNQRALEKLCPPAEVTVGVGDRKSTRLNS